MELTMFERLQELPLLQGISQKDIQDMMMKVQLDFRQHLAGEQIVEQDESCRKLIFVMGGTLSVEYRDMENDILVTETVCAPCAIEPYSMFGMRQRFTRSYTFESDGSTLIVPKQMFSEVMMGYSVVKTNMLNMVCNKMQQATAQLMQGEPEDIRQKVINLIKSYCITLKGEKDINIKMDTIAYLIGETRLNVSGVLRNMSGENLITQRRNGFRIKDMQRFISLKYIN